MTVTVIKKFAVAGLFLVPVAVFTVACGPVQSQSDSAPAPSAHQLTTTPKPAATSMLTAKPKPPTFAPLPRTTTAASGPQCHYRYAQGFQLPDPKCTPGSVQSTSVAAICVSGWSAAHREYFTKAQREAAFARYGIYTTDPAGYGEYDHLIPLELGGSNNADNLWPEKGTIPNFKDPIENALHDAVCAGRVPLRMAQQAIAADWPVAGTKVIEVGPGLKATTSAPKPATRPATTTAAAKSCSPTTSGGNCYKAGELCRAADHNASGTAGNGTAIRCEDNNGWRWETV